MSGRRMWLLATVFCLPGCCGTEHRAGLFGRKPCDCGAGPSALPPGTRIAPYPTEPAGGPADRPPFMPPAASTTPTQLPPYTPPPTAGDSSGPVGKTDPAFRRALDAQTRTDGPQKYVPDPALAQVRLDSPIPVQTDAKPQAPSATPSSDLPRRQARETQEPPPVDVPGYVVVRGRVATGLQPFPDGIAWLQSKGYHTVLHLRAPGEDGTAARRQFEKRGLQYVSLEVAPGILTKDLADQFNRIIADETNLPLFVYDKDGALTGSLWYMQFRLNGMPDDKALAEANRLGFRPEQDEDHKAIYNAARVLLAAPQP